jgi:CubicO group peptidase (beta-lactamase class C family)
MLKRCANVPTLLFRAIVVVMVASGPTALAQPSPHEGPAAEQFAAWLATFNKGDRAGLLAYHQRSFPYSTASHDVGDVDREAGLRAATGGFDVKKSEAASPTRYSAVLKERHSQQFAHATMQVDATAPHRVVSFEIHPMETPDEFLTPEQRHGSGSVAHGAEDLPARIDKIVADTLVDGPGAGAAVMVVRKGQVIVDKGYGKADLELDVPMTEKNLFRIGSITKQFTAAAIMRLVEKGKLKLDEEVGRLLPGAPLHGKKITITQLLTHTSGLKNFTELPEWDKAMAAPLPPARLYELLKDQPLDFEPGQKWHYSNTNYYLLGVIIEKASGHKYADFVRDEVTARAGLAHTIYCDNDPLIPGRARGYSGDGPRMKNARAIDMSGPFAAGGLCSTVDDLVKWAQALASGKVVSPASYAKMTTPVKPADGSDPGYGFGLGVTPIGGHRVVEHNGGINGFGSALLSFPDDGVVIAVLANSDNSVGHMIAPKVAADMLGLPLPPTRNIVPLVDAAKFVGVFDTKFKEELHRLHVYREAGHLWLRDEFDGSNDRLDYLGSDEFAVHGAPFFVRITAENLVLTGPLGEMSGPRINAK